MSTATIDFSKYESPADGPIDFSKYEGPPTPEQQIEQRPGMPAFKPKMEMSTVGKLEGGDPETNPSGSKVPRSIQQAPDWVGDAVGGTALGGAALLGAAPIAGPVLRYGAKVAAAHPIASTLALSAAQHLPGAAGKIAGKIPSWLPLLAGGKAAPAAEAEEGAQAAESIGTPAPEKAASSIGPIGAEENQAAASTIKPTVSKIADQVQEGLGGKKLLPNVPLRMQPGGPGPKPAPAAASIEPEHMGQFARANGYDLHKAIPENVEGDVLRAKIHNMTNVQVRQLAINAGEDMGQQAVTNAKNAGGITRQDVLKRVMAKHSPDEIGKLIDQGKHLQ